MSGRLFGLGLGPGDPELLTLKARRLLREAAVVAYPAPEGSPSLARRIAEPHLTGAQRELPIALPMSPDPALARPAYDAAAAEIAGHLGEGRDVAVLCEGDPFLYGSFMYLFERLGRDHPVEVVPGIASVTAAAAAAGRPLASRNEAFAILPAPLDDAALARRLLAADGFAILKPGRHFSRVKALLARLGLLEGCTYVERATQEGERILPLRETGDEAPYFALILGRGRPPAIAGDRTDPALLVLAPSPLAEQLVAPLGAELHGLAKRVAGADVAFADAGAHLRSLFLAGRPIVAVMAAGAVIRLLAPVLRDKGIEPPVVALAEDGSSAVPLLGGHHGANDLARRVAQLTGGHAAVTTAGDLRYGLALDAPPPGWRLDDPASAKPAMAALLAGVEARIEGPMDWLGGTRIPSAPDGLVPLLASARLDAMAPGGILYRPATLVLGIGAERGAPAEDAIDLAERALAEAGVSPLSLAAVASLDLKADEPAVHAVAAHFAVPARFFTAEALEAEAPRLQNPSDIVFAETGCHGVAEGAALAAAAGPEGRLILPKRKGARVTAALAEAPRPLDPLTFGRARGRLFVVGIGPGSEEWRSPAVTAMIAAATDLVGYSLYLDLLGPLAANKRRHDFDLGAEEARVRHAMELAGEGRDVALVCSGDAGIYAMATLVFELLDKGALSDAARRIAVEVSPGISALQAAAARAGAPLGHDFCTISLSDLLTPWPAIERRIEAAASGDFVVAFYNPVSKRRRTQLEFARQRLLEHRPADTPVVVAANLGRPGENVRLVSLADLDVETVDMLTVVIVGSSETRLVATGDGRHWAYTPRGYSGKAGTSMEAAP